jgi:hypothetical protein
MEVFLKKWSADSIHLLRTPIHTYLSVLKALDTQAGDHLIVDPLIDETFLKVILDQKIKPIFIDFTSSEALAYDIQLLEDFLSLSSMVNEQDLLIYRKDNQVIRGIVLTQHDKEPVPSEQLAFIAKRYHLPLVEDFTYTFSQEKALSSTQAQIAIAKVTAGTADAGLFIQRKPAVDPLALLTSVQNKELHVPKDELVIKESLSQVEAYHEQANYPNRSGILKKHTFLSRNKVAEKLLKPA